MNYCKFLSLKYEYWTDCSLKEHIIIAIIAISDARCILLYPNIKPYNQLETLSIHLYSSKSFLSFYVSCSFGNIEINGNRILKYDTGSKVLIDIHKNYNYPINLTHKKIKNGHHSWKSRCSERLWHRLRLTQE